MELPGVLWVYWGGLERIKPALPYLVHASLSKAFCVLPHL